MAAILGIYHRADLIGLGLYVGLYIGLYLLYRGSLPPSLSLSLHICEKDVSIVNEGDTA